MSRTLAQLLGKSEQVVASAISKFEELSGSPCEDLRLLSDNKLKSRKKISELGLDPDNTTGEELYHTLLLKYQNDSQRLDKAIGIAAGASFDNRLDKAMELVEHTISQSDIWTIKQINARRLLRANPPKKLMKQLGYRSPDSMLKREAIESLFLTASYSEASSWQKEFRRATAKLNSADYVMQPAKLVKLTEVILDNIHGPESGLATSKFIGAAAVWPSNNNKQADTMAIVTMLATGLEEIGAVFDYRLLSNIHPVLNWWADTSHLASIHNGETVSFNLKDVAMNFAQQLSYANRLQQNAKQSLWRELTERYQRYSDTVSEIIPEVEASLSLNAARDKFEPVPRQLAAEAVEA